MNRPSLNSKTNLDDYFVYYWLKEELIQFCRQHQLPTSGSKEQLSQRAAAFLSGKPVPKSKGKPRNSAMPSSFTRATRVEKGWRCSQALRLFFKQEISESFHFDKTMRDLIHNGVGKTLDEVIRLWLTEQQKPKRKTIIAPQFEYNQFIREYFQLHAQADFKDAVKAWHEHKSKPKK